MPSKVDRAKLMPASENDVIDPGSCYLACLNVQRKTEPESYWIVLRAPREWLPDGFFDTRPVQVRVFPFWIIGRKQRVWLPRSSLFYLDKSQLHIFANRQKKLEFANLLTLVTAFRGKKEATKHFEQEILDSTKQYNERRGRVEKTVASKRRSRSLSSFMEEYAEDSADGQEKEVVSAATGTSVSQVDEHVSTHPAEPPKPSKRQRREPTFTNTFTNLSTALAATPSSTASPAKIQNNSPTKIKMEEEEHHSELAETVMNDPRVRIYVGPTNTEYLADAGTLQQKSPILYSFIQGSDEGGKFIMHPKLREIGPDDFYSLLQYVDSGEYHPALVPNPDGNDQGPMGLDGKSTVEEYSAALVQAGRLFLLARMFNVQGMTDCIVRKVMKARYKQYNNLSLIEFGRIMLTRVQREQDAGEIPDEYINIWIVNQLAGQFMEIFMGPEVERYKYLEFVDQTKERAIHAVILDRAAHSYRMLGGLPVIIEDEDSE